MEILSISVEGIALLTERRKQMDDLQIIELYWAREEAAIAESSIKYGKLLHHIAYNILANREDSEECVSSTYGRAWDTMPPQKPGSLSAYLGRITRNLSINRWYENRAQKRGGGAFALLSELSDCIPSANSVEAAVETNALAELISRWLRSLPKEERTLFLRRYWFGDSLSFLAKARGTSANQLAGRIYRLRQKLKVMLEQEGVSL